MSAWTEEDMEREERWSRGCALGEAVWLRVCSAASWDPKDDALVSARSAIVEAVRAAFYNMEGEGLDGLSQWLELEEWAEMKGAEPA
jgi:hypothetical protein